MNLTVQQALSDFYKINNFGEDGGVSKKFAWIKFGPVSLPIPNTDSRKRNVCLHDIGHLITKNDTTWKGESSVSAWEIASGGWGKFYFLWALTLWAMGLGVVFYPKHIYHSFRKGLTMRNTLTSGIKMDALLKMTMQDLEVKLSDHPKSNRNVYVWMSISFAVFIGPFVLGLVFILMLANYK